MTPTTAHILAEASSSTHNDHFYWLPGTFDIALGTEISIQGKATVLLCMCSLSVQALVLGSRIMQ